jgi:hypothetical protein
VIMGGFAMARPAPGRTSDERESLVAAGVPLVADRAVRRPCNPCLAEPLASFTRGAFLKSPFLFRGECEISRAEPKVIPG